MRKAADKTEKQLIEPQKTTDRVSKSVHTEKPRIIPYMWRSSWAIYLRFALEKNKLSFQCLPSVGTDLNFVYIYSK